MKLIWYFKLFMLCNLVLCGIVCANNSPRCVRGDCEDGTGVYLADAGLQYSGEFKDGRWHGRGKIIDPRGDCVIRGQFKEGFIWGYAENICPEGVAGRFGHTYRGSWVRSQWNGQGTASINGKTYKGEWAANQLCFRGNCMDGSGAMVVSNGSLFIGDFKNGRLHGRGRLFNALDKHTDVGYFRNGVLHGMGKRIYENGKIYIGEFVNGVPWGDGTMFASDGTVLETGYWWSGSAPGDFDGGK